MARFAPVVPVQMAAQLQLADPTKDYLGPYHLLLAHDVLDKPRDYQSIYGEVRRKYGEQSFIIMDNSIVELGEAMGLDDLAEACRILNPDCLVIPDVMGDGAETRAKAKEFCRKYAQYFADNPFEGAPDLMGVIQGSTVEDCILTCALYYSLPLTEYISVPRVVTKQQGSRMPVLVALAHNRTYELFKGLHLLGFSDNILDDVSCARLPYVQGIDSAVPIRAGLKSVGMSDSFASYWSGLVGPRGNFWERPIDADWRANEGTIFENLKTYRDWIGDR